jgi:phosphoenolpyruvate-protein kinase (PTS system EI component)
MLRNAFPDDTNTLEDVIVDGDKGADRHTFRGTHTGGILSHAAVVAREVGIPAVMGTRVGTATIRDGQMVEVDGRAGVVRILD